MPNERLITCEITPRHDRARRRGFTLQRPRPSHAGSDSCWFVFYCTLRFTFFFILFVRLFPFDLSLNLFLPLLCLLSPHTLPYNTVESPSDLFSSLMRLQ